MYTQKYSYICIYNPQFILSNSFKYSARVIRSHICSEFDLSQHSVKRSYRMKNFYISIINSCKSSGVYLMHGTYYLNLFLNDYLT